jgi:transcriptional regulator
MKLSEDVVQGLIKLFLAYPKSVLRESDCLQVYRKGKELNEEQVRLLVKLYVRKPDRRVLGLLTIMDLARECGVLHNRVRCLVASGRIPEPSVPFGKKSYYRRSDLPALKAAVEKALAWRWRHFTPAQVANMVALYESGQTQGAIAKKYGARQETVGQYLRRAGVKGRMGRGFGPAWGARLFTPEQEADMVALYQSGLTHAAIAEKYKSNKGTIARYLRRAGVKGRIGGCRRPRTFTPEQVTEMVALYQSGWTYGSIAEKYKSKKSTVGHYLKRARRTVATSQAC